ncbi:MsnO8 family LLM class oxidoreductase [Hyalangium gracile]|uniref:MsnO8 family LLM class oxidoreductase n=1 Tax=Hyalangium gracile TaxID=394092 RepID=UPI001CCAB23D|nr:MsnO8 family LLM class oxidoreductase [Hyalangium gracile]
MSTGIRLGVLDFSPISPGTHARKALFDTLCLARAADSLGFSRYWLAEHHQLDVAHHSPETLLPLILGATEQLRVGVAGILLRLHSPMRVAKAFRTLNSFFSGRLDLGVAGGKANSAVMRAMLDHEVAPESQSRAEFARRFGELMGLLRDESPLTFNPPEEDSLPVWLHGSSSLETAELAARYGTCFGWSLAHPFSQDRTAVVEHYRQSFRPRLGQPRPEWVVAIAGVCAETEREAHALARESLDCPGELAIVGTPTQCREKLEALRHRYGTDEFILRPLERSAEARLRCLRLFASALGLRRPEAPGPAGPSSTYVLPGAPPRL